MELRHILRGSNVVAKEEDYSAWDAQGQTEVAKDGTLAEVVAAACAKSEDDRETGASQEVM